ncbi:MAG: hypothetical protein NVV74_11120 [Magnetospirillum sp.]|nr:hypothetical protein [Magnetospirillum sp.]
MGVALGLNSGDVDGDGVADLMVGAPHNTAGGNTQVGNVHVVYGHTFLDSDVWAGTAGADLHTGTAGADKMVGDLGNDTLIGGGGADVLYGGNGADLLVVADDAFRRVDGGSGTDTLKFTGTTLDFTTLGDGRARGIEILDLAGNGGQSVRLSRDQVMDLADSGNVVTIDGDAADRVVLADAGWSRSATTDAAGYYTFSNGLAQVRVKGAQVALGNAADPAPTYWMSDLTNGLTGYTLYTNPPVSETYLGQSTQYLGDINGDGFGDFIASVYQEEGDWADLHVVTGGRAARGPPPPRCAPPASRSRLAPSRAYNPPRLPTWMVMAPASWYLGSPAGWGVLGESLRAR